MRFYADCFKGTANGKARGLLCLLVAALLMTATALASTVDIVRYPITQAEYCCSGLNNTVFGQSVLVADSSILDSFSFFASSYGNVSQTLMGTVYQFDGTEPLTQLFRETVSANLPDDSSYAMVTFAVPDLLLMPGTYIFTIQSDVATMIDVID